MEHFGNLIILFPRKTNITPEIDAWKWQPTPEKKPRDANLKEYFQKFHMQFHIWK